jgi:hypothetical protein
MQNCTFRWSVHGRVSPTEAAVDVEQYAYQEEKVLKHNKANSHKACCAHAVPLQCRALIHICHAVPLPCSDSAVSFMKVRVVVGNIRTASPTV